MPYQTRSNLNKNLLQKMKKNSENYLIGIDCADAMQPNTQHFQFQPECDYAPATAHLIVTIGNHDGSILKFLRRRLRGMHSQYRKRKCSHDQQK